MAFSLALPSLSSVLRVFYPLKIYESGNKANMLPCDILDLQVVESNNIPAEPIDSNSYVSDTFFKMPKTISARVYVTTIEYNNFKKKLDSINAKKGFDIQGVDNQKYESYRLESYSETQSADVVGAYIVNLTFKEAILVGAFSGLFDLSKLQKKAYSSKINQGEKKATERPKSALKSLTNLISGN